eukprot:NODE_50_length_31184_cov_0.705099.p22 type:complete len:190 gc:universal NODE_50_length_31184_cov_0.705099:7694-7125(-)
MLSSESIISKIKWANYDCIEKKRIHKSYRIPELNKVLVLQRTSTEAKLLCKAKLLGLNVPAVFYVEKDTIYMEYLSGKTLLELQREEIQLLSIGRDIGRCVAKLHNNGIIHGDLSPMNIIVQGNIPFLIDFGLAFSSKTIEDLAVDLVAFEKVLNDDQFFEIFYDGYKEVAKQNLDKRIDLVRERGRKR